VSLPCVERFTALSNAERAALVPAGTPVVVVEAGVTRGWTGLAGPSGWVVGLDRFGESAPGGVLFKHFGFTVDHLASVVREVAA
jgi:transketolase